MSKYIVKNRIPPVIVTICEMGLVAVMILLVLSELLSGREPFSIKTSLACGGLFLAAFLHFCSIKFFRIEIGTGTLSIRTMRTLFRTVTVEIEDLDPIRFVSGGPAYSDLLVLSVHRRKLAKVSVFCTNADVLYNILTSYGKLK